MIASKLTRVAQRAPSAASITSTTSSAAYRAAQCIAGRQPHQRRHSSSKASCPPDSSPSGGKPTPAAKTSTGSADAASSKTPISDLEVQHRGSKRIGRKQRPRAIATEPEDRFAGLPSVPTTQHLHQADISTSSFFSLHRPLSIATTFPPPSTALAFDRIFEQRNQPDPWQNGNSAERRPEDVIYTLHNTVQTLEAGANATEQDGMRWEIVQDNQGTREGVKHLDGAPRIKTLDELVAQFRPFLTPPPPQTFTEETKTSTGPKRAPKDKQAQRIASQLGLRPQGQPRQKSYTTTIIVTESTGVDGQRTYTASSSPIVRLPDPEEQAASEESQSGTSTRFPFRERMMQRQQASMFRQPERMRAPSTARTYLRRAPVAKRPKMLLISVKRQRKLKMKKHKYKKLMRRTRNLRRRQDRA